MTLWGLGRALVIAIYGATAFSWFLFLYEAGVLMFVPVLNQAFTPFGPAWCREALAMLVSLVCGIVGMIAVFVLMDARCTHCMRSADRKGGA